MIYIKGEKIGIVVEDGLHGYVTLLGDDDEHIAASPGQADALLRGLLRWGWTNGKFLHHADFDAEYNAWQKERSR